MPKHVLITGVSRGLGLALCEEFLRRGDIVYGVSKSVAMQKKLLKKWPKKQLKLFTCDVTKPKSIDAAAKKIKAAAKHIDILINNVGYGGTLSRVEATPLREYEKHIQTNLSASFLFTKHFLKSLLKRKGIILNISSMAGIRGVPRLFAYSAAKFGLAALTECIVKENENTGLECLLICPGGMNTKMRSGIFGKKDAEKQQSPEFVADIIFQIMDKKLPVPNGSKVIIRHGKVTNILPLPAA